MAANFSIALDISALSGDFKAHAQRGTGRYVKELSRYFDQLSGNTVTVSKFAAQDLIKRGPLSAAIDLLPAGRQTLKQQLLFPFKLGAGDLRGKQAVHFPAHIDAPAWCRLPTIVTVLDLIPVVLADLYKADRSTWRFQLARRLELQAIRNAALILAISQNTADDVHRVLGVPYERIVVTPLGVDRSFFECERGRQDIDLRESYEIPHNRKIVLYVGGIDQRKNIKVLIKAFKQVCDRMRTENQPLPVLVMAGGIRSDLQYPQLLKLIESEGVGENVVQTGFVTDGDLLKLYGEASVFFFPSLYEGFGLGPLEAMAAGTPVVSSDRSSLPEVLGTAAFTFNPEDCGAACDRLYSVLSDSNVACDLSERGRAQARSFTWERTGELTFGAYRQLADMLQSSRRVPATGQRSVKELNEHS